MAHSYMPIVAWSRITRQSYTINVERFAGLSIQFQPCEVFRENTFMVPWPAVFVILTIAKYLRENFCIKNHKNRKS